MLRNLHATLFSKIQKIFMSNFSSRITFQRLLKKCSISFYLQFFQPLDKPWMSSVHREDRRISSYSPQRKLSLPFAYQRKTSLKRKRYDMGGSWCDPVDLWADYFTLIYILRISVPSCIPWNSHAQSGHILSNIPSYPMTMAADNTSKILDIGSPSTSFAKKSSPKSSRRRSSDKEKESFAKFLSQNQQLQGKWSFQTFEFREDWTIWYLKVEKWSRIDSAELVREWNWLHLLDCKMKLFSRSECAVEWWS